MAFTIPNLTPAVPEIFILAMACLTLLADLFVKQEKGGLTFLLSEFTLLGAAVLSVILFEHQAVTTFHGSFVLDHLATVLKLLIYTTTFFVLLYSRSYINERQIPFGETYILTLFCVLGMMVLVSAGSFITLFLGLELFSLPLYAIIALQRDKKSCQEAAIKYFVMGAIASGILLYGLSMIYGATRSLDISIVANTIAQLPADQNLILIFGLVFVIVGFAFKLGAVPFHMWVPDVYEGAPSSATLLIATAPKIAAFGLGARLLIDTLPALQPDWQQLLIIIAMLSMTLGNFAAIVQTNLKRMLAYSSIAHMGYMMLGFLSGTASGYGAATFYICVYALTSLGAFGLIVLLSRSGLEAENIADFRGLNSRNPWLAFIMLLIMFSMGGVPPLVGFFAKLAVLESLISAGFVWLAVYAMMMALVGVFYYLRVVKVMYFDQPDDAAPITLDCFNSQLAITVNGLLILALGLLPSGLYDLCRAAF